MNFPEPRKRARASKLTRLQQIELWAWYCARKHLGTPQSKARELGVKPETLRCILNRLKKRAEERA
jgi:hypothetical protein